MEEAEWDLWAEEGRKMELEMKSKFLKYLGNKEELKNRYQEFLKQNENEILDENLKIHLENYLRNERIEDVLKGIIFFPTLSLLVENGYVKVPQDITIGKLKGSLLLSSSNRIFFEVYLENGTTVSSKTSTGLKGKIKAHPNSRIHLVAQDMKFKDVFNKYSDDVVNELIPILQKEVPECKFIKVISGSTPIHILSSIPKKKLFEILPVLEKIFFNVEYDDFRMILD